jgi:hypothetical protein
VRFGSEVAREKSGHFRRDFMKAIDRGLQPLLRAQGLPLVLAGVEEETSAFSAVSNYAELLPEPVQMSPDGGATDIELAKAGKQVMKRRSFNTRYRGVAARITGSCCRRPTRGRFNTCSWNAARG